MHLNIANVAHFLICRGLLDAALVYKLAPAAQALAHYFAGAIQAAAAGPWQVVDAPAIRPTP